MIKSMTGFGRYEYVEESREYKVEIKSVNNRYSDIGIKLPRSLSSLEENVKKQVSSAISRGKVDVFVTFTNNSAVGKDIKINTELAEKYIAELKKLAKEENIIDNVNVMEVSRMPEVLNIKLDEEDNEIIWKELSFALQNALDSFISMREVEGQKIKEDLERRIFYISEKIEKINSISTGLIKEYIVKLEKRINDLLGGNNVVDESRLAQEVVIYSDKCSVEEEITRLKSHITQFLALLDESGPVGKKLDFLVQEMNRETNTIGSKANNLEITNLVVDIKTEIENIREQIQNIE